MFLLGVILVALAVLGLLTVLALQAAELLRHPWAAAAAIAVEPRGRSCGASGQSRVTRLAVRNYNSLTRALGNRAAPPGSNRTG